MADHHGETGFPDLPLVIVVAPYLADRVDLAERLDGFGPVGLILVPSLEDARRLLQNGARPAPGRPPAGAGLAIDPDLLLAHCRGRRVALTPLEHDLLRSLASEPRQTWSYASLHQRVWQSRPTGGRTHIYSTVRRLRRKLAAVGAPETITPVRGIGYRLAPPGSGVGAAGAARAAELPVGDRLLAGGHPGHPDPG